MSGKTERGTDRRIVFRRTHEEDERNFSIIRDQVERRRSIRRGREDRRGIEKSLTETVALERERRAQNGG